MRWLKHAFAVDTTPAVPTAAQQQLIDHVCREIIRRQMTLPAQMMLESSRPMSFLTGQSLRVLEPLLGAFLDAAVIREFADFMERPGSVEYICQRLEILQHAANDGQKTG